MHTRILSLCTLLAFTVTVTACNKKAPPNGATAAGGRGASAETTSAKTPVDEDEEDNDGDDAPDKSAPVKASSAKADADDNRAHTQRILAKELPDPHEAAKRLGPPKVVAKKDPRGTCGEINVGGQTYKLDCDDDDYGMVKGASEAVMDEDEIGGAAPVELPKVVDFRAKKLTGPIIDQGHSLSCTAVSLAAVVNHELGQRTGKPGDVSALQIWGRYANPKMDEAISRNQGKGIASATLLPYDAKLADKWDKTKPPAPELFAKLDSQPVAKIVDVVKVAPKSIKGTLAQGHAIWFAMAGAHGIQKTDGPKGGPQIIPAFDHRQIQGGKMGHAMALMGYRTGKSGKTYYLIQNSWGQKYGEDGYAYIDEDTFMKNLRYAYSVDVQPANAKAPSNDGTSAPTKCKPGLLPDAETGKCAPRCPDGSARNGNVCAEAEGCDKGEVNVKGRCVRAAPTMKKKKNGFAMSCVPGGCAYGFAKGVAGCAREKGCVLSCPAPNFKLVKRGGHLACN